MGWTWRGGRPRGQGGGGRSTGNDGASMLVSDFGPWAINLEKKETHMHSGIG